MTEALKRPIFIKWFNLILWSYALFNSSFLCVLFSIIFIYPCVPFPCSGFELDFTYILWAVWASRSFETFTCKSFWERLVCFFICFLVPLTHGNYKPLLISSGEVLELCHPWLPLSFKNLCLHVNICSVFMNMFLLTDISACEYCGSVSGGGRY